MQLPSGDLGRFVIDDSQLMKHSSEVVRKSFHPVQGRPWQHLMPMLAMAGSPVNLSIPWII
jgi:hypothetical protein